MRIGEGDLAGVTSWVEKASILVLAEDRRQIGILDGGSFCRRFVQSSRQLDRRFEA